MCTADWEQSPSRLNMPAGPSPLAVANITMMHTTLPGALRKEQNPFAHKPGCIMLLKDVEERSGHSGALQCCGEKGETSKVTPGLSHDEGQVPTTRVHLWHARLSSALKPQPTSKTPTNSQAPRQGQCQYLTIIKRIGMCGKTTIASTAGRQRRAQLTPARHRTAPGDAEQCHPKLRCAAAGRL